MDMMTRTAILAGSLVLVAIAAAAGWWVLGDELFGRSGPSGQRDAQPAPLFDDREGSLYDEFGEARTEDALDDRITIRAGQSLDAPPPPAGTVSGLPDGPQFGWERPITDRGPASLAPAGPLPRTTPAERVEADCRGRGGGSYACRCLVRLARTMLEPSEFDFLSVVEERDPRADRLSSAGLALSELPGLTVKFLELDANARRRCGAGLKP